MPILIGIKIINQIRLQCCYKQTSLSGLATSLIGLQQSQWPNTLTPVSSLSGVVVSVSSLRLEGWGSNPSRVIPKTLKMGPNCLPAWHAASGVGLERLINGHRYVGKRSSPIRFNQVYY